MVTPIGRNSLMRLVRRADSSESERLVRARAVRSLDCAGRLTLDDSPALRLSWRRDISPMPKTIVYPSLLSAAVGREVDSIVGNGAQIEEGSRKIFSEPDSVVRQTHQRSGRKFYYSTTRIAATWPPKHISTFPRFPLETNEGAGAVAILAASQQTNEPIRL